MTAASESAPTCLVLMPINAERHLKREIDRAIGDAGLVAVRVDDLSAGGLLLSAVWQAVRNARCILADLTGKNPNVFYELGLAHAMGKPTLLIAESLEDVPFDLRYLRIIRYDPNREAGFVHRRIAESLRELSKEDSTFWNFSLVGSPSHSEGHVDSEETAEEVVRRAEVAYKSGFTEMAIRLLKEGADAYQAAGNDSSLSVTLNNLGSLYQRMGDYSAALSVMERAVDAVKRARNPAGEAAIYGSLANVLEARAEYSRAEEFYRRALAISAELHDDASLALHLSNLGTLKTQLGDYSQAEEYYRTALEFFRKCGDSASTARMLINFGTLRLNQHRLEEAESHFGDALALFAQLELRSESASALHNLASVMLEKRDLDSAENYLQQSLQIKKALGDRAGIAASIANLGSIAASRGDLDYALRLYQQALTMYQETGNYYALAQTFLATSRLLAAAGRKQEAVETLVRAEELSREGAPVQHNEIVERLNELRTDAASERK